MKKRVLAGLAAMAVGAVLVPMGGPESSAHADEVVVDASEVTGTVLTDIEGHVEPVAGAEVTVSWVPGLDTAKVGDELPLETIAVTQTRANGSYELDLAATPEMQEAADRNGGYLNFDVGVADAELAKIDTSSVTRQLSDDGEWDLPDPEATEVADVPMASALRAPAAPKTKTTRLGPQFVLSASSQDGPRVQKGKAAKSASSLEAPAPGRVYCSFIVDARPTRPVNIIEFHNASNSAAKWTYGEKGDSDIDVAMDYKGDGGWLVSGNAHIGNDREASVYHSQSTVANNFGTTDFTFVDGHYKPALGTGTICDGTSIPVNTKSKRPITWVGGVGSNRRAGSEFVGCENAPQSTHRNGYGIGDGFARKTSNASKISGAVDLGVFKVGAQSGFSAELDVRWDVKKRPGIWLCGTNYFPPTAGVIHAQNRP